MINVIIVDDEPLAQDVLETYIEKIPELHLSGKCSNALVQRKEPRRPLISSSSKRIRNS
jgi:response regulator of citrate/malate metabolism